MKVDHLTAPTWDALHAYSDTMMSCIETWKIFFQSEFKSDCIPTDIIMDWLNRTGETIDLLRHEYVYDAMRTVGIDSVGSGFPQRLHIQLLTQLRREALVSQPSVTVDDLKRSFLDQLFKQGQANCWTLERIAKTYVKQTLKSVTPISLFKIISFENIGNSNGRTVYRCRFERYCYRNVPAFYSLVFECSNSGGINDEIMLELGRIFDEETSQLPQLGLFAKKLDQAHALIHPKWVGRIILGPVFISGVTKDEHELQKVLDESSVAGEFNSASRIIYEYVVAEKVAPVSRLYDATGRKHPELQEFAIRQFDAECVARSVTHVEKHLFAPHKIVQRLSDKFRTEIGHTIQIQGD